MADLDPKSSPSLAQSTAAAAKLDKRTIPAGKPANLEDQRSKGGAFKTFLWVAPLTALIWIYAEREQLDQAPDARVKIKLVSRSTDRLITTIRPTDHWVNLDIHGPKASLTQLRDLLAKEPLEVSVDTPIGYEGDISLAEPITKTELFKANAATVSAARPPFNIKVEAKGSKRIPVMQRPQDKVVGNVTFEPPTVLLEGPKDTLDHMRSEDLVAYANLGTLLQNKPGEYTDDVAIALPNYIENVTMRDTVRAKVKILQSKTFRIQSMGIVLQLPGLVVAGDRYKVSFKPNTITSVEVTGPPDAIELLEQAKFTPRVVLDLTNPARGIDFSLVQTTMEKSITLLPTDYQLPPGVEVRNATTDVTVTVTKRGE